MGILILACRRGGLCGREDRGYDGNRQCGGEHRPGEQPHFPGAVARLTREKYKAPGVTVNIAVLPENDLRQKLTTEASTGGTTYDMFYFGPYEAQTWAKNGWLENLEPYFEALSADKLTGTTAPT